MEPIKLNWAVSATGSGYMIEAIDGDMCPAYSTISATVTRDVERDLKAIGEAKLGILHRLNVASEANGSPKRYCI